MGFITIFHHHLGEYIFGSLCPTTDSVANPRSLTGTPPKTKGGNLRTWKHPWKLTKDYRAASRLVRYERLYQSISSIQTSCKHYKWQAFSGVNLLLVSRRVSIWAIYNDQPAEVTPNGGLVRESPPKWPKKFRLRIYINCPDLSTYLPILLLFC